MEAQPFSCAEVLEKKIKNLLKTMIVLFVVTNAISLIFGITAYKLTSKKIYHTYFCTERALEQIHHVNIHYGDVTPPLP